MVNNHINNNKVQLSVLNHEQSLKIESANNHEPLFKWPSLVLVIGLQTVPTACGSNLAFLMPMALETLILFLEIKPKKVFQT